MRAILPKKLRRSPAWLALCAVLPFATSMATGVEEPADKTPDLPAREFKVVVKPAMPFAFEEDGELKGMAVDLWKRIAEEMHAKFEAKLVDTMPKLIAALKAGEADVGVGAISITDDREEIMDFTHPFFESGLQVMVRPEEQTRSNLAAFTGLFSGPIIKAVIIILGAVFLVSNILWYFERRVNSDGFPHHYFSGLWESAWWSISVLISGGCENKAPVGIPGRLVAVAWMLAGIALTSFITASLASAMVSNNLTSGVNSLADVGPAKVGSVRGSSAVSFLKNKTKGLEIVEFEHIDEAINALHQRHIKAVVYDGPVLQYFAAKNLTGKLEVVGPLFDLQDYGFGLHLDSPYRKKINEAILKLKKTGYLDELERKWLGSGGD